MPLKAEICMTLFFAIFFISFFYHSLGITVGYHRLLSHHSFKVPKWLEYFIISGAYLCLEGSPISWVTAHRLHHRYSDHPGDPHSPVDGFWHAFIGWMFEKRPGDDPASSKVICAELWRDPVYRFLDANHTPMHAMICLVVNVALRVLIYMALGPVAVIANVAAALLTFASPLLVNSICHLNQFGYQNYDADDDSRNVWWVGLLAMGEGWHNNHHAIPASARHGLRPHEIDVSWIMIRTLEMLGLAKDIRLPKAHQWPGHTRVQSKIRIVSQGE